MNEQNTLSITFISPNNNNSIMTLPDVNDGKKAQYFADRIANFVESENDHFLNIQEIYDELNK